MKVILVRISFIIICTSLFIYFLIKPPVELKTNNTEIIQGSDKSNTQEEKKNLRVKVKFNKEEKAESKTEELTPVTQDESLQIINLDEASNDNITPPEINLSRIFSKIVYPASMKKKNIQTSFNLTVYLDKSGNIDLVFPLEVEKDFEMAVRKAFSKQNVKPALLDKKPVSVYFTVPVEFTIR